MLPTHFTQTGVNTRTICVFLYLHAHVWIFACTNVFWWVLPYLQHRWFITDEPRGRGPCKAVVMEASVRHSRSPFSIIFRSLGRRAGSLWVSHSCAVSRLFSPVQVLSLLVYILYGYKRFRRAFFKHILYTWSLFLLAAYFCDVTTKNCNPFNNHLGLSPSYLCCVASRIGPKCSSL